MRKMNRAAYSEAFREYIECLYHAHPTGCGGSLGEMAKMKLDGYRCERCEHEWVSRNKNERPRVCPKCKNPYWDRPRQLKSIKSAFVL